VATFGVALAVPLARRGAPPLLLLTAGVAFAVALVFRMLDQPLCGTWPAGTHFLWHTFNGLSVGLALLAAERVGPATKATRARARAARRCCTTRVEAELPPFPAGSDHAHDLGGAKA
jgi:hypothetical protein